MFLEERLLGGKKNKIKSIIELGLSDDEIKKEIDMLFNFRKPPNLQNKIEKAYVGLIFLIYVYKLKSQLSYHSLWKKILTNLLEYSKITTFFLDTYFTNGYPNNYLKESIELACKIYNLRNDFNHKDEHQYIRNTLLLQIGLLKNSLDRLKLWLSNYNLSVVIKELLDIDSENYSEDFHKGWRTLRRFRDNIISYEQAKKMLSQNIWFSHLDIDKLLKLAKQKIDNNYLIHQDENDIFYLDKIKYTNNDLIFIINARDLYLLNLSGFRYNVYIDEEYKGILINNSTELVLDSPIEIIEPESNQIDLKIKNEDGDIVYSTQIMLFDFSEQLILFDEDGKIYNNIFKKLNTSKKYHILMDSDLDCNFNKENQREYFDGYALLIPFISYQDDCKVAYKDEILFELNFKDYIEKPEFIDKLIIYSKTEESFIVDNEYFFELKIMEIKQNGEDIELKNLPKEAKIVRWTYSGGFIDNENIENNSIKATLYPEMIVFPKHTLLIKYKNKVFKKVIYCKFFEKKLKIKLFKINLDRNVELVNKEDILTREDLKNNQFYLSDFNVKSSQQWYLKNKSYFYQTVQANKIFKITNLKGFGEEIFINENLFNDKNFIKLFNYVDNNEFIFYKKKLNQIILKKKNLINVKVIFLLENFKYNNLLIEDLNNKFLNFNFITGLLIENNTIIDSIYSNYDFQHLNFEILKNLLIANYPIFLKDSNIKIIREFIKNNLYEFFKTFYNDTIKINGNSFHFKFSNMDILIEHLLFDFDIEEEISKQILKNLILDNQADKLLNTPIILFKLLQSAKSEKLIYYFYDFIKEEDLKDERDENFTFIIINSLFHTKHLKGIDKHNLKIAMHYINGKYYLKKALKRLLNG
jgi:hypothetical protein